MPLSIQEFKGVFNAAKRRAAEKFNRRESKVDEALTAMMEAVKQVEAKGGNAKRFYGLYKKLTANVLQAEELGKKDPKKGYEMLKKVKESARQQAANAKQELYDQQFAPETVAKVKGVDHPIQLHPQSMPGVDKVSKDKRAKVVAAMTEKMAKGKELLDTINALDDDELTTMKAPDRKDVADLMWYIKAMAEEKAGEAFAKGAMTVPDPGNKLRKYLDRCSQVYGRDSSHLKEQQNQALGQARGIDFYEGNIDNPDLLLPYGMNTVLTQTVRSKDGTDMLYVKMETESARFNPTFKKAQDTPDARDWTKEDVGRSIKHLINLLKAHEDGSLKSFREQLPEGVGRAYAEVITTAKKNGSNEAADLLAQGYKAAKKKSGGKMDYGNTVRVNGIIANFEAVKKLAAAGKVDAKTIQAIVECENKIVDAFGSDNNTERFGGEILLNKDDLTGKKKKTTPGQEMEDDVRGELEIVKAGLDEADESEGEEDLDRDTEAKLLDLLAAANDASSFVPAFETHGAAFGVSKYDIKLINEVIASRYIVDKADLSTLTESAAQRAGQQRKLALAAASKTRPTELARTMLKLMA
jgi:hypothetical protein